MMRILNFLFGHRPAADATAGIAKERLQIVLSHERASRDAPSFLPALQRDLLAAIGKYVTIKDEFLRVNFARRQDTSVLEVNVTFDPATARPLSVDERRSGLPQSAVRFAPPRRKSGGKKRQETPQESTGV
jgi:cell division topological specificity factor